MTPGRRAKRWAEAVGFRLLAGLVRALPYGAAARVGAATGRFAFALGLRRRVAVRNVEERLAPPGGRAAAERIARESYEVAGRTFVSLLCADRIPEETLFSLVDRRAVDSVRDAAGGGGAVLVSGHFGNWELFVLAFRRSGIRVAAMAGDQSNAKVDAALRAIRARAGVTPLSARTGLREALRILRSGGLVATLADQDARSKGVFVEFLGAPASAHVGVVSMIARGRATMIPGALVDERGCYHFVLGVPWRPDPARSDAENERDGAVHFHRFLEEQVRRHPGNYLWAHRRWKTKPPAIAGSE